MASIWPRTIARVVKRLPSSLQLAPSPQKPPLNYGFSTHSLHPLISTHSSVSKPYDVLIAGAGPVGLMLATELQLAGAKVLVIERNHDFITSPKAGGINTASVEAFQRRGLLPALQGAAQRALSDIVPKIPVTGALKSLYGGSAGHFGGVTVPASVVYMEDPILQGRGKDGWFMLVPQVEIEKVLFARAEELGVDIRRGVTVEGLEASGSDVTVRLKGNDESELRVPWLIGCDGGHSLVRRIGGFDFPGTDPQITGRVAVVEIEGTEKLKQGSQYMPNGVYVYGPLPGRVRTVEFDGPPTDKYAPLTAEEIEGSLRRVSGLDEVRVSKVLSGSRFTDNARQTSNYRRGRVFLCGDAAHVHSPFSGQGLNLGLGDAVNLGWKLAGVIKGRLSEKILDTYSEERHPIGMKILDWTRAQVGIMRGDPDSSASRGVMTDLLNTRDGATHYVKQISGLSHHYELGLSEPHPLVGKLAPKIAFDDDTTISDYMREGQTLVIDLTVDGKVASCVEDTKETVKVIRKTSRYPDLSGLLIRPDGFVAWAAGSQLNRASLESQVRQWVG